MTFSIPQLLVVDDEPNIVYTIAETLGSAELKVVSASTGKDAIESVRRLRPDVVLLDVRLPDMSGLDAFDRIHQIDPLMPVIIMTAFAKTDTAIEAMRRGAFEYFLKPVDFASLRHTVDRAVNVSRLNRVPAVMHGSETEHGEPADVIIGNSSAMQEVYKTIGRVAPQDVTVLILGESGTGKELVSRAIYHYSRRNGRPFLAVNCAALPEALLESELFGHERGAFTGADNRRIGKFEQVNGGTIFLDEIGDMSPATQAKALRLIQEQKFERVGGNNTIQTDVRIIAATNKDLEAMVAEGKFRQDLYYRLSGFTLHLPPLRERMDDIRPLTEYFLTVLESELHKPIRGVESAVWDALQAHHWPGNVRELYSAIRYAMVHSTGEVITVNCLPRSCRGPLPDAAHSESNPDGHPSDALSLPDVRQLTRTLLANGSDDVYREIMHAVDQAILEETLDVTGGNQVHAAEKLGISRMTLRSKLKANRNGSPEPG